MTKTEPEITGTILNWRYDSYYHWLEGTMIGDVRGRFRDGAYIHTSRLRISKEAVKALKEGDIVKTTYSTYKLGAPLKIEKLENAERMTNESLDGTWLMFAVREEDDKWILCIRRGRAIRKQRYADGEVVPIQFSSRAKGKACVDILNEKYLAEYDANFDRNGMFLNKVEKMSLMPMMQGMMAVIEEHRMK